MVVVVAVAEAVEDAKAVAFVVRRTAKEPAAVKEVEVAKGKQSQQQRSGSRTHSSRIDFGQGGALARGHFKDGTESGKPPIAGASAETSTSGAGDAGATTILRGDAQPHSRAVVAAAPQPHLNTRPRPKHERKCGRLCNRLVSAVYVQHDGEQEPCVFLRLNRRRFE